MFGEGAAEGADRGRPVLLHMSLRRWCCRRGRSSTLRSRRWGTGDDAALVAIVSGLTEPVTYGIIRGARRCPGCSAGAHRRGQRGRGEVKSAVPMAAELARSACRGRRENLQALKLSLRPVHVLVRGFAGVGLYSVGVSMTEGVVILAKAVGW